MEPLTPYEPAPDHSPELGELAGALAKAQAEMGVALKGSDNPFFKSSYADLASIIEAGRPLSTHGLAVTQFPCGNELVTMLIHSGSGQWLKSRYTIKPVKDDPQGRGSALTYARRYAYQAIAGLASADDDGEGAMDRPVQNAVQKPKPKAKAKPVHTVTQIDSPPDAPSDSWQDFSLGFGKHRGKTLGDLVGTPDASYITWLIKQDNSNNPELAVALELAERELGTAQVDFKPSKAKVVSEPEPELPLGEEDELPF